MKPGGHFPSHGCAARTALVASVGAMVGTVVPTTGTVPKTRTTQVDPYGIPMGSGPVPVRGE